MAHIKKLFKKKQQKTLHLLECFLAESNLRSSEWWWSHLRVPRLEFSYLQPFFKKKKKKNCFKIWIIAERLPSRSYSS